MDESTNIEIRFKPQAAVVSPDEVALLESILPEIIRALLMVEPESRPD
ncbi:MAG TPA: hypothetical protein VMV91_03050 [Rhodocyclaceae bacterium]|nr:hypothetical protein [Rhodocyclaceae bacterium]